MQTKSAIIIFASIIKSLYKYHRKSILVKTKKMTFDSMHLQGCDKRILTFSKNALAMSNVFKRMNDGINKNFISRI